MLLTRCHIHGRALKAVLFGVLEMSRGCGGRVLVMDRAIAMAEDQRCEGFIDAPLLWEHNQHSCSEIEVLSLSDLTTATCCNTRASSANRFEDLLKLAYMPLDLGHQAIFPNFRSA